MKQFNQWESLLLNLGEWQGSFARLSPTGEWMEETQTVVLLEGLNENQTIRQKIIRLFADRAPEEKVLEYSSLGRSVLFFANGAFSQGSMQWGPFSEFGAELGLIEGDRRLRLVQLFNPQAQLDRITLIREKLQGSQTPERPDLTLDSLLGEWQGEAITLYPDWRSPDTYSTILKLQKSADGQVLQQLTFGSPAQTIASTGKIDNARILFDQSDLTVQVLMLPDGASSTCPIEIKPGRPFFLEVGWLLQTDRRQRMIRRYDDKGAWVSLTLVTERKL